MYTLHCTHHTKQDSNREIKPEYIVFDEHYSVRCMYALVGHYFADDKDMRLALYETLHENTFMTILGQHIDTNSTPFLQQKLLSFKI